MKYDIWIEGFRATGQRQGASKLTKEPIEAESWDEAIKIYKATHPGHGIEDRQHTLYEWHYRVWGCRLYDNEADARKSFG